MQLPVLGVPVQSKALAIKIPLSIVQMPAGIRQDACYRSARAKNAALSAAIILASSDTSLQERLQSFRSHRPSKCSILATKT